MLAFLCRIAFVGAALALIPLSGMAAAGASPPEIEQAVQAYANKIKADQEKAMDQAVVNRTTALLRDPATQVLGNPEGDVAVVEFFDYTCPYCKAVEPRLQKLLQDDKGVKLVVKEFPILSPVSLRLFLGSGDSWKRPRFSRSRKASGWTSIGCARIWTRPKSRTRSSRTSTLPVP